MQMLAGASKVVQKWGEPEFLISTEVMANQWKHFAMADFFFQLKINSSPIAPIAVSCAQTHLKTCNESSKVRMKMQGKSFYIP